MSAENIGDSQNNQDGRLPFEAYWQNSTNESQQDGRRAGPYSPVQLLFLLRLARCLRQRQEYLNVVVPDDWRMRLINKAIYSTFCDCLEQGIGDDAKVLFKMDQATNNP